MDLNGKQTFKVEALEFTNSIIALVVQKYNYSGFPSLYRLSKGSLYKGKIKKSLFLHYGEIIFFISP